MKTESPNWSEIETVARNGNLTENGVGKLDHCKFT